MSAAGDPAKIDDPASASNPNEDHTTVNDKKPDDIFTFLADPEILPTTDKVGWVRYALSLSILLSIVAGLTFVAHAAGVEILETPTQISVVTALVVGALLLNGTATVDYWELVTQYWWLTIPAVMSAGLFFVLMDQGNQTVMEGME